MQMNTITNALFNLRQMDDFAHKNTLIHRINPLAKIMITMLYLLMVVSYGKYDNAGLIGFALYPLVIVAMADLPVKVLLKRLLILEPIVIGIGLFSPIFDQNQLILGSIELSAGWVTFLSILLKGSFTISAGILLIATTGMDRVAEGLRILKVPRIMVLQILLTYRYILVLIEEISRMSRAYFLRAPTDKGIQRKVWGSFAGQLLLRTYDRAQRIYVSMTLRGFRGEYHSSAPVRMKRADWIYVVGWALVFSLCRWIPVAHVVTLGLKGVLGL